MLRGNVLGAGLMASSAPCLRLMPSLRPAPGLPVGVVIGLWQRWDGSEAWCCFSQNRCRSFFLRAALVCHLGATLVPCPGLGLS